MINTKINLYIYFYYVYFFIIIIIFVLNIIFIKKYIQYFVFLVKLNIQYYIFNIINFKNITFQLCGHFHIYNLLNKEYFYFFSIINIINSYIILYEVILFYFIFHFIIIFFITKNI